jgi:hypothetical protein
MNVMPRGLLTFVLRNLVLAMLLGGMAVGLSACPEHGTTYMKTENGGGHNSGGSGMGGGGSY